MKTNEDISHSIRAIHASTIANITGTMLPFCVGMQSKPYWSELIWLPNGTICWTSFVSLVHEWMAHPRLKDKHWHDTDGLLRNLIQLHTCAAISLSEAVFLFVSAEMIGEGGDFEEPSRMIEKWIEQDDDSHAVTTAKHYSALENAAMSISPYDEKLEIRNKEFRECAQELSRCIWQQAMESLDFHLYFEMGIPYELTKDLYEKGKQSVEAHIQRERAAILAAL